MVKYILIIFLSFNLLASPIEEFENTPVSSPNFISSSFAAAKAYIEKGHYQKAITIAQFYRHNFLATPESVKLYFEEPFYQLEIYSLLQLCQWQLSKELLNEYYYQLEYLKLDQAKFEKTKKQIELSKIIKKSIRESKVSDNKLSFLKLSLFRVNKKALTKVAHPKNIHIRVQSQCDSRL